MTFGFLLFLLISIFVGVLSIIIYFLPAFIAFRRNHPNKIAITLLTFFFGATLIVWVICLIWALSGPPPVYEESGYGH